MRGIGPQDQRLGHLDDDFGIMKSDSTPEELINGWIRFSRAGQDSTDKEKFFWAYEEMARLSEEEPERCLEMILGVLARDYEMPVIGALAAGPMEDLLANCGEQVIDRVTELARVNEAFRTMLGGVWKNEIDERIWSRVRAIHDNAW